MTTGSRISTLRVRNNWSQTKLARLMKTNISTIQKWETDNSFPRARHIIELAILFGVTSDYILCIDNRPMIILNEFSEEESEFLGEIAQVIKRRKPR